MHKRINHTEGKRLNKCKNKKNQLNISRVHLRALFILRPLMNILANRYFGFFSSRESSQKRRRIMINDSSAPSSYRRGVQKIFFYYEKKNQKMIGECVEVRERGSVKSTYARTLVSWCFEQINNSKCRRNYSD